MYDAWQIKGQIASLNLTNDNSIRLEGMVNSSILEILKHEALSKSLGRVTNFVRTTPEAQKVARDALKANRLSDTINGEYVLKKCTYLYTLYFPGFLDEQGIENEGQIICPKKTDTCAETDCDNIKSSPYRIIGGCCNNLAHKTWGKFD